MRRGLCIISLGVAASCSSPTPSAPKAKAPTPAASRSAEQLRTDVLDRLFGTELTRWIIELNQNPTTAVRPELPTALATDVRDPLLELLTATEVAARATDPDDPSVGDLAPVATRVNSALREEGLAYALDTFVTDAGDGPRAFVVLLFSFAIERVRVYVDESERVHSVQWATRLDQIGYRYRLIGFASKDRPPIILLDSIDELMCTGLLGHETIGDSVGGAALASSVARAAAHLGGETAAMLEGALGRRRALFESWNELGHFGGRVKLPTTRVIEAPWRTQLDSALAPAERAKLAALESELASVEAATAYGAVRRALVTATEHHEIQHKIDLATPLESSIELQLAADSRTFVLGEMSALLAELARAPSAAHFTLARMAPIAESPSNSLERLAVRRVLFAIAGEQISDSREELGVVIKSLATTSHPDVARRAASAWTKLFGRKLVSVKLSSTIAHE